MFDQQNRTARDTQRVRTEATGSCKSMRGFEWQIKYDDLSQGGCRVDDPRHVMELGSKVNLFIAGAGPFVAEVAWRQGDRVGLEFTNSLPDTVFEHLARGEWEEAQLASSNEVQSYPIRRVI